MSETQVMTETPIEVPAKKKRGRPFKNKTAVAAVTGDPLDRKLDHFQYTKDERELEWWEGNQKESPLHVPEAIRKANPGMRFHWVSKGRITRLGKGYHGWQVYSDRKNPDGVNRGNDLILAAMPEERAAAYNKYVSRKSTEAVRGAQARQFEHMDTCIDMGRDAVPEADGGTAIGVRPKVGKGGGYARGYDPEQVKEIIAKNRERMSKHKKIFI